MTAIKNPRSSERRRGSSNGVLVLGVAELEARDLEAIVGEEFGMANLPPTNQRFIVFTGCEASE
jgi:hypothetical protein